MVATWTLIPHKLRNDGRGRITSGTVTTECAGNECLVLRQYFLDGLRVGTLVALSR
jgi:hypothetical protein